MLYDQGQLANAYLDAFSITKNTLYSCVVRDILDYLRRDMIGPNGEIFSAEDADSAETEHAIEKKEGAFYVWTSNEVYAFFFVISTQNTVVFLLPLFDFICLDVLCSAFVFLMSLVINQGIDFFCLLDFQFLLFLFSKVSPLLL